MELRQRVRASPLYFGKKSPDDPDALSFWLCEGLTKRHVRGSKTQSLEAALREWNLASVLENSQLHFMNESSGLVVPVQDEMGKHISDRDVVRICDGVELDKLLEKFACRNGEVDAEIMAQQKPSSINAALTKLKRFGATNPTINKLIQKTFDDRGSPRDEESDLLERYPSIDPIFEYGEVEELADLGDGDKLKCDVCEVSWPDDTDGSMYRLKKFGIVTHHGCAQFASDIMARFPELKSREDFLGAPSVKEANRQGTFHVTVHHAMDLPPAQLVGVAAPYAKLSMLPWKESMQTKPSENGGRNPVWKNMHDNVMQFSHMYNGAITPIPLLEVEIWNSNYLSDDMVACALLDMTPLLRYPHVEVKRWFTLSSPTQSSVSKTQSTGQAKVLLSIRFVPMNGSYTAGNEHKFRVHQLKSVGLAIPNCAVCDRVIVNALKSVWGYRCETCGLDVHKACIMRAMTDFKCTPLPENDKKSSKEASKIGGNEKRDGPLSLVHRGADFKIVHAGASRRAGDLFVNLQGLHVCTKQCQPDRDFHAKNIFEGDYYCRLTFDDIEYETSPVLKSADPMFMERVCFKVGRPESVLCIEVVDFNTDLAVAELKVSIFQLLQREADKFIRTNKLLAKLKVPLRQANLSDASLESPEVDLQADIPVLSNVEVYSLFLPAAASKSGSAVPKSCGYALMNVEYVESKSELLSSRNYDDFTPPSIDDRDFSVDSLKVTFERLNRAIMTFRWFDAEYARIISWKNKKKSAVTLVVFVYCCVFIDLEYAISNVLLAILAYMVYQLHLRLEGAFARRWIDYSKYDLEQEDKMTLYRPLADLHVAVHEARTSQTTEQLLKDSQGILKDVSSSKLGYYVRVKFIPNDKKRSKLGGDTVFIPSEYDDVIVAVTNVVEKTRAPVWRKTALTGSGSSSLASTVASLISKQRKNFPLRNFNESWRHDPGSCYCDSCILYRADSNDKPRSLSSSSVDLNKESSTSAGAACGVDHHAYYFPIPQACRKNFAGIEDVVPWKLFPGLLKFDLCVAVNGEAKDSPDVVVGTGYLPLRSLLKSQQGGSTNEILVSLSTTPVATSDVDDRTPLQLFTPSSGSSASRLLNEVDGDQMLVRVKIDVPSDKRRASVKLPALAGGDAVTTPTSPTSKKVSTVSRAERSLSEFVMERLTAEKEKTTVLGGHLLDAFWKVKDTVKNLQIEVERACGFIGKTENLLNWTHPWKTAAAFAGVSFAAVVFSVIPGRWLVLLFGLTEFGAVFLEDLPPSNRLRKILWNFISSLPSDQDLIDAYEPERKVFLKHHASDKEMEEEELLRLRLHALWAGLLLSKAEGDRSFKTYFVVYRAFRFLMWKSAEDADAGAQPHLVLLFDRPSAVTDTSEDKTFKFQVRGITSSGNEETRVFSLESMTKMDVLLTAIFQSCAAKSTS